MADVDTAPDGTGGHLRAHSVAGGQRASPTAGGERAHPALAGSLESGTAMILGGLEAVTPLFRCVARPGSDALHGVPLGAAAAPGERRVHTYVGPIGASCEQSGPFTVFMVPYSEHSSFPELCDFVRFCRPARVVLTATPPGQQPQTVLRRFSSLLDSRRSHSLALRSMWASASGARPAETATPAPLWVCPHCSQPAATNAALHAHLDECLQAAAGSAAGASERETRTRHVDGHSGDSVASLDDRVAALRAVLPSDVQDSTIALLLDAYPVRRRAGLPGIPATWWAHRRLPTLPFPGRRCFCLLTSPVGGGCCQWLLRRRVPTLVGGRSCVGSREQSSNQLPTRCSHDDDTTKAVPPIEPG